MVFCKRCMGIMTGVTSFKRDGYDRFYRCSKCYEETGCKRIRDNDLEFEEILMRNIHRRGNQ